MAMQKKKAEEENVTCLLHLLSSFINPRISRGFEEHFVESPSDSEIPPQPETVLPSEVTDLLRSSCLFSAIAGYLRNDSGNYLVYKLY